MWMLKRMQNPQNDRTLMISFLIMHLLGGPVGGKAIVNLGIRQSFTVIKGANRLFHVKGGCVDVLFIRDFMDGSDHPVDQ